MTQDAIGGISQEGLQDANTNGFKVNVNSALQTSSIKEKLRKPFNYASTKKIDWPSLRRSCNQWIKNPLNMTLLLWIICVAVSGAILFLVMTGMLNKILTKKSQRDSWFEVNNQFLNALFTLMCLHQHPKRFHRLVLLCRWKPKDITILREIYCKNGTCKPHERFHMMVVVVLLHVNCFSQYALCGLNWGFNRSQRPFVGVGICISIAISAPALAGVYFMASPLGKEYESTNEQVQNHIPNSNTIASRNDIFLCQKQTESCVQHAMNSLPPEDKVPQATSMNTSSFWSSHGLSKIWSEESNDCSSLSEIEVSRERKQNVMEAPIPLSIQIDDNDIKRT